MKKRVINRERLVWAILLGSFSTCLLLSVAVPLTIDRFVQQARRPMVVEAQANEGTVGILQEKTGTQALFAGTPAQVVGEGSRVLTSATDTALLLFYTPDRSDILGRLQIYANTNVVLDQAELPRYQASRERQKVGLILPGGRIRLDLPALQPRPLDLVVETPHGQVSIAQPGQYSVEASTAGMQVAVQNGAAQVSAAGQSLLLASGERAVVPANQPPTGPLGTERNLLRNGDFNNDLEGWLVLDWNLELPDQPSGVTTVERRIGEPTLVLRREGVGHADAGVRQIIDQDVTDFSSLRLSLNLRVQSQSLGVCGNRGSECPLMVRIAFEDAFGVPHEWQQGFFATGDFGTDTPDVCISCPPPRNPHVRINPGQITFYESDNLLVQLQQQDLQPRRISNVSLIASGHSFEVELIDVALLADE